MRSFLVSFCNFRKSKARTPLGLFALDAGCLEFRGFVDIPVLDQQVGITGLCRHQGAIYAAVQTKPSSLCMLRPGFAPTLTRLEQTFRLHSMLSVGNELFLVSTGTDCVLALNPNAGSEKVVRRLAEGSSNTLHLNGIADHCGSIAVSMMGQDRKGWVRTGEVRDLLSGETMLGGLREPHSVVSTSKELFVLESATSQLFGYSAGTVSSRAGFAGYVRGLHIDDEVMLVGRSRFRAQSGSSGCDRNLPHNLPGDAIPEAMRSALYGSLSNGDRLALDVSDISHEIYDILALTQVEAHWLENQFLNHKREQ